MSRIDFTISVEQILPSGESEYHLLSTSSFHESLPMKSLFSSFEHQVSSWLDNEAITGSSFRFNFCLIPLEDKK